MERESSLLGLLLAVFALAWRRKTSAPADPHLCNPSAALRNFTPFLMLDHFNVGTTSVVQHSLNSSPVLTLTLSIFAEQVAPGAGFPDHPHRGMTTMTYMLTGEFQHEDFLGHKGLIGPGDLQWMIAAKGIVHAEMPIHRPGGDNPTGLQL